MGIARQRFKKAPLPTARPLFDFEVREYEITVLLLGMGVEKLTVLKEKLDVLFESMELEKFQKEETF